MDERSEPAIDGESGGIPGITIDWLFTCPSFGITRWNCSAGQRSISVEKHQYWHVISFVHAGTFVLHSQGRSELIDPTAVLLYNPWEPFRSSHPFGCHDHGSAVVIRRDALLDVLRHHDPAAEERFAALFTASYVRGLSRALLRQRLLVRSLERSGPRDPLAFEAAFLKLMGEVAAESCCQQGVDRPTGPLESARSRRRYVEDAKILLQERFRERLHLEDIARALYVSTFHLCRLFKEETGMPIHHYLNRFRLRAALDPVMEGTADLSALALDLGFSSHSHFTAAFRREFGLSPRELRRAGKVGSLVA